MLQIKLEHKVLIATEAVDFRKGIDGLVHLCKQELLLDPFSGTIFIFSNRSKTSVRVLVYDSKGFWLCTKRLSNGRLAWWPKHAQEAHTLTKLQLQELLYSGNPKLAVIDDSNISRP